MNSEGGALPPITYRPLPAGLIAPCVVTDVPALNTTGDIVESRRRYKAAFDQCATKMNKIIEFNEVMPD